MKHDAIYFRCIFGLFEDPEECSTLNFKSEVTEEIVSLDVFETSFLFQSAMCLKDDRKSGPSLRHN